jgi:hypothetical protein
MENTPRLYDTLLQVLSQHAKWLDRRHRQTLAWMMVGLIHSGWISLTAWAPYVVSRAQYAQSTVRRFRQWLDNNKIESVALYGPLIQHALAEWGAHGPLRGSGYLDVVEYLLYDSSLDDLSRPSRAPGVGCAPTRQRPGEPQSLPRPAGTGGAVGASTRKATWACIRCTAQC